MVGEKPKMNSDTPSSILIIGSGVFGLSTALELARRPSFAKASITVLDRSPDEGIFPSSDSSSNDSSRIIRPDYADPAYAALAAEAQQQWRQQGENELGGQGRYTESGMVLMADAPLALPGDEKASQEAKTEQKKKKTQMGYVRDSWQNVRALASAPESGVEAHKIHELPSRSAIIDAIGADKASHPGDWGYFNGSSGWANATKSMAWFLDQVHATRRVIFRHGTASSLTRSGGRVTGAKLLAGDTISADLVVLATGAWTGGLIDLAGQAIATGQVLAYIDISPAEQAKLSSLPVILNLSSGLFVIPPAANQLKAARHGYGYVNPQPTPPTVLPTSPDASPPPETTSLPRTALTDNVTVLNIPPEGETDLRKAIRMIVPLRHLHDRPFSSSRLCWYTDTPTGDFLVDYHPGWKGLFVATGGSGHGFKFLPIIGQKIVDCIEGNRPEAFDEKWRWRGVDKRDEDAEGVGADVKQLYQHIVTEDGSRGGKPGLVLEEELARGRKDSKL